MGIKQVFPNSAEHLQRVRTWMSLLVAFPILTPDDYSERLPKLWLALDCESIPSTRYYIEWFILLGLLKNQRERDLQYVLGRLMEFNQCTGTAVSLLSVIVHLGVQLFSTASTNKDFSLGEISQFKLLFQEQVFDRLLPWFLHNNHMVRLFALFTFDRLWNALSQHQPQEILKLPQGYTNMALFLRQSERNHRFLAKLENEYFLSSFDPLCHYSLATIFKHLPNHCAVLEKQEIISPGSFYNINPVEGNIPFGDEEPLTVPTKEPTSNENLESQALEMPLNFELFQRKLDPWDMDLLEKNLSELQGMQIIEEKGRNDAFDFIVVATLVDRIPNLAGLCRTCEIFGVRSLVLPSLKIIEDGAFQGISMTSERWLRLEECSAADLSDYLEKLRMQDYRIVAIEQTSQGNSLLYYQFPSKCCLILGNENSGIPAEILHKVDDCVEIPQFGVIRSLNVHVSGSIVLWEARRQHSLTQEGHQ